MEGLLSKGLGYLRSIPRTSASWYVSAMSMAQIPVVFGIRDAVPSDEEHSQWLTCAGADIENTLGVLEWS